MFFFFICLDLYRRIGCYKDKEDSPAIPSLEGLDRILDLPLENRTDPILKCYLAAKKFGYSVFALQNKACMSSKDAIITYPIYSDGGQTKCKAGEGGVLHNTVYVITSPGKHVCRLKIRI